MKCNKRTVKELPNKKQPHERSPLKSPDVDPNEVNPTHPRIDDPLDYTGKIKLNA